MAKGSPTKSGSSPKGSKKEGDDKKGKKGGEKKTLPKWSADECIKADAETFARRRYETPMDAAYKRVSHHIVIIVKHLHIFEVFNEAPEIQQFCNSNKGSKESPKSKGSPKEKGKKSPAEDEPLPPINVTPMVEGVVAVRRNLLLQENEKLFIEVAANWEYEEKPIHVTPFVPQIRVKHQCYRDYYYIQPSNFERPVISTPFNQTLVAKIRFEYGAEWDGYPFQFDLTGAPSSLTFNRPYDHENHKDGIFWELRCFVGKFEFTKPTPDKEARLDIWKFTIAPSLLTFALRKSTPCNYIRHKTDDDIGDLFLSASLNRDLYYHGEEISVTINIENNSQRHVISSITVFMEQTYRFFHEIPQDNSIPLNEVWLKPGENGLPINPKAKGWSKTVQIKPMYDWSKYNLVCDGKMERDEKIFLASSTIIMKDIPLTPEEIEALEVGDGKSPKANEKNSKGSPKKDSPKKGSPKKDSPKKGSPKKEPIIKNQSIKTDKLPLQGELPLEETGHIVPPAPIPTKRILVNREICHSVFVSYDIVVRANLKTPTDKEAGHPAVRVPFVLTRETKFINKWTNSPAWNHLPLKCDKSHTMKSQPHSFCKKFDVVEEIVNTSPNSKIESRKKSKSSPKSKKKS